MNQPRCALTLDHVNVNCENEHQFWVTRYPSWFFLATPSHNCSLSRRQMIDNNVFTCYASNDATLNELKIILPLHLWFLLLFTIYIFTFVVNTYFSLSLLRSCFFISLSSSVAAIYMISLVGICIRQNLMRPNIYVSSDAESFYWSRATLYNLSSTIECSII